MILPALLPSNRTRGFRVVFAACAALLLAMPLVAMGFTGEVNWGLGDFLVAGAMLALLGLAIDLALRARIARWGRTGAIVLALAAFLLIWAELAVGLFD